VPSTIRGSYPWTRKDFPPVPALGTQRRDLHKRQASLEKLFPFLDGRVPARRRGSDRLVRKLRIAPLFPAKRIA
jgi:hypothetical protein